MKVCVDIQAGIGQQAGVGRYVRHLVPALAAQRGDDELSLFYFDFQRKGLPLSAAGVPARAVCWCPGRVMQKAWKTVSFPPFDWLAGRADVYHFPNFVRPPLRRGRSVVTIHDVSFLRHPETTEAGNLHYLRRQIHRTVQQVDAIITDSEFSRREIMELLQAEPEKVRAVHLGLDQAGAAPDAAAVAEARRALELSRPYLLTVGTVEPRKNLGFMVELFEELAFEGDLVIAGMLGWKYEPLLERIAQSPRRDRIRLLNYVPEALLPALYTGAEAFIVTSLYEGFGFPPLEAMSLGVPVVSSCGGSLPEVLGEAARLVPHFDLDGWRCTVEEVLGDEALRASLRDRGRRQAAGYTWERTAKETWNVYRQLNGGRTGDRSNARKRGKAC